MSTPSNSWLHHPEHGELPAQRLIDCVFALAPNGRILHFHIEQTEIEARDDEDHYLLGDAPPAPERSRCQIIPPFVNVFKQRSTGGGYLGWRFR